MKKKLFVLLILLCLTGCTSVQKTSLDDIVSKGVNPKIELANENRAGYQYYLPKGLRLVDKNDYNERIKSGDYTYYLYVDVVSYFNKVIEPFESKDNVYYSKDIANKDKFGYLEIKMIKDNKYLIEIMYNYAKIEVIVREQDINVAVSNCISVLSSIKYNDKMLDLLIGKETSSFSELEYDIFKTKNIESSYLQYVKQDEENVENIIHDGDLVN